MTRISIFHDGGIGGGNKCDIGCDEQSLDDVTKQRPCGCMHDWGSKMDTIVLAEKVLWGGWVTY